MATIDFSSVATDMARLKAYQNQLSLMAPTDPGRGLVQAEIAALQDSIAVELQHAQSQADSTANMFTQLQWTSMLGQSFTGLSQVLPSIIAAIK